MTTPETENTAPMWAIVELMGHVKTGALISKDNQLGTAMLRVDVPQADGSFVTQLVNPASIYRLTFCAEPIARACASQCTAKPLETWELKHLLPAPAPRVQEDFFGSTDERDGD
jgi:hypothetical protein